MTTPRSQFLAGIQTEAPILLAVIPFGLIYGVVALAAGLPPSMAQAMSFIVFAGSAQFVIAQLVTVDAPGLVIVATAFVVNLRHVLYSASVAPYINHLPGPWKRLLAYLLTDEAYAVTITHFQQHNREPNRHWYFLGAGLALWVTWQASTAAGLYLGAQIPASWPLDFAIPLTFIALVVPLIRDRASAAAALAAGSIVLLVMGLPYKLGLIVAALLGMTVGVWVESSSSLVRSSSTGD